MCVYHKIRGGNSEFTHRLHAKLGEEDETAKLYNRFLGQAESIEVYKSPHNPMKLQCGYSEPSIIQTPLSKAVS